MTDPLAVTFELPTTLPHRPEHAQHDIRAEDEPVVGPPATRSADLRVAIDAMAQRPGWGPHRISAYLRRHAGVDLSSAEVRRVLQGSDTR